MKYFYVVYVPLVLVVLMVVLVETALSFVACSGLLEFVNDDSVVVVVIVAVA